MTTTFSKEQIHVLVKAIVAEMQTPAFCERTKAAVSANPIPATDEDVLVRYESVQADFFANQFDVSQLVIDGSPAPPPGKLNGNDVLRQMREACKNYKDPETERAIMQLCVIEESQIDTLLATVPELAPVARAIQQQQQNPGHQHSHGNAAASRVGGAGADASAHGHSHDGAPCHGHSHGGAGGGGAPGGAGAMPQMTPQGMMMVEMAMQTLTAEQRDTLERVQSTMQGGSPPAPEDMRDMFMIQQQIMAFVSTMQQFQGRGRGGAATGAARGRGAGR